MPAIAEYLVKADQAALKTLYALEKKSYIFAAPFDRKAAIECALLDGAAMGKGDKKDGSSEPWQKIKIDRQIIAIGRAHNVSLIISSDKNLKANADRVAIPCLEIDDLELPDSSKQQALFKTSK